MPVNYGLLRGSVINALPYQKGTDHYQIEVKAAGTLYRIAVDVYSELQGTTRSFAPDHQNPVLDTDRMVMYYKDENYSHPVLPAMLEAEVGLTPDMDLPEDLLLDYIRYQPALFPLNNMKVVPPKGTNGQENDLDDDIGPWIQKAMNNPQAEVFAFGSSWNDSNGGTPDPHPYFNPDPTKGIHDIHMNQGDTGQEAKYNGIWQDGALFLRFMANANGAASSADQWVAMFFRFQNQSINTDINGNPVSALQSVAHSI